jgi:pSer/pThr/pTyr-binding forkhead associated (FHA) protein/predicted outer membrane lipoprotein
VSRGLKYLLLPIMGALAALLSFACAWPFMKGLFRDIGSKDPSSNFTYGTTFGLVQSLVMGSVLSGTFCLILESGRRKPLVVLRIALVGAVIGGILTTCANNVSDLIGIEINKATGTKGGTSLAYFAWIILVPASYAFSIAVALGLTKERVRRAFFSVLIAVPVGFAANFVASFLAVGWLMTQIGSFSSLDLNTASKDLNALMWRTVVNVWMVTEVANGVVIGLTTFIADKMVRRGSLRQIFGRKEQKDWSLDYAMNRIGSGEVEIRLRGHSGVELVHACVFRQGHQFVFDSQHAPSLVNGYPASQVLLNHGDQIQIGDAVLFFEIGNAPLRVPVDTRPSAQYIPQSPPQVEQQLSTAVATPVPIISAYLVDLGGVRTLLTSQPTTIGREGQHTILLNSNKSVSRNHASLVFDGERVTVTDLGSSNGTFVNRNRINSQTEIQNGDKIAFGFAQYHVEIETST